jgi:acyl-coenzyme A synthetase/AMP-(fatty) acid ligase
MKASEPPARWSFVEDVLDAQARAIPEATALLAVAARGHETPWSYGAFAEQSSRLAHVLQGHGLARGEIVPVIVASLPHAIIARLALMRAGGVGLLLRAGTTPREMAHYVERTSPRLAIAGPEDVERFPPGIRVVVLPSAELDGALRAVPPEFPSLHLRSDEPEHIVPTGGTTGLPKLVLHTHGSRAYHYLRWTVGFAPGDLSWDLTGRWWLGAWRHGTQVFDRAMPAGSSAELVLETLMKYPITKFMGPARLFSEMLRLDVKARALPHLRLCCSGGQALDPTIVRGWKAATGLTIYDRYGQSEQADSPFQLQDETTAERGCLGKPFPWIDLAIVDQEGRRLSPGELGDIAINTAPIRPPWLFREYLGDPAATAARHRGDWYLTGDVGRMDPGGFVFMVGRADDVINCGGSNIGPWELESVLLEHAAVREVAVVGKPHPDLGHIPKAFVVAESGISPADSLATELLQFVNGQVHPHKRLHEVEFLASLPKTPEGKIRRSELR